MARKVSSKCLPDASGSPSRIRLVLHFNCGNVCDVRDDVLAGAQVDDGAKKRRTRGRSRGARSGSRPSRKGTVRVGSHIARVACECSQSLATK
jgi:hypothetical protein